MKHSLLFGNGLNLLGENCISWDSLLTKIHGGHDETIKKLPNIMQYEKIFLDKMSQNISSPEKELSIKNEIVRLLSKQNCNEYYEDIIKLGFENYLTTNYDSFFEQAYNGEAEKDSTEKIYSVRRKTILSSSQHKKCNIWSVHGEISYPKTIMLGLDHYCGAISKIDRYVKGEYEYQLEGDSKKAASIAQKIKGKVDFDEISWIELFFNTNMHILGFSLDFNEIDIWWILNKRARLKSIKDIDIGNKIYFHSTNIQVEKRALLESMGVTVLDQEAQNGDAYVDAYKKSIRKIKSLSKQGGY